MKKNRFIIIILICAAFIILIIALTNQSRQKAIEKTTVPQLETPFTADQTAFALPSFTGVEPTVPARLPLLNISFNPNKNLNGNLKNYCQIISSDGNFFLGEICSYYFYDNSQNIEITNNSAVLEDIPIITQAEALTAAQEFLQQFVDNYMNLKLSITNYWAGDYELFPANEQTAQFVQLNYDYHYQNIAVLNRNSLSHSILLLINQVAPIQKAELPLKLLMFEPQKNELPTIDIEQSLINISQGRAYVLSVGNFTTNTNNPQSLMNLSSLHNIVFNDVVLEYRYDSDLLVATPSYHFFGSALDSNSNRINLEVITAAVQLRN